MTTSIKEALKAALRAFKACRPVKRVACQDFGMQQDDILQQQLEAALSAALATLQPEGERREAIARIICYWDEPSTCHDNYCCGSCRATIPDARFLKAADQIILASGLVQDEAGWRDINTAPKSHNIILFAVTDISDDGSVKNWKMGSGYFAEGYNAWRWENYVLKTYDVQPTHWMPLPAPPIRSARDGGAS